MIDEPKMKQIVKHFLIVNQINLQQTRFAHQTWNETATVV